MSLGEMNCFEKVYVCMQIYKYNVYIRNICSLDEDNWSDRVGYEGD